MAEFHSEYFAAADEALRSAGSGPDVPAVGIMAFYRAVSLWRLGGEGEAREVAARARYPEFKTAMKK